MGPVLVAGYNLELLGGRLHSDFGFAFSWGAFPALTGYFAQAERLDLVAILVAGNNESTDELRDACRTWDSAQVLHGTGVTLNGASFFGLGGGIPFRLCWQTL